MFRNRLVFPLSAVAIAAAAFASPAMAQTSVTLSGMIDAEINTQTLAANGNRVTSINGPAAGPNGGLQTSYFQFAGDEDLGGGMKASFALGGFFRPGTGQSGRFDGDTLFSRDADISLSGDFGKVTMGRQINPQFLSMLIFNPFADSFGFSPIIQQTYYAFSAGNVWSPDTGYSNAVSYSTPNFSGLSAEMLYSLSGQNGQTGSFSGNVLYFHGPFAATFAYERSNVADSNANNTYTLGGGYPVGTTEKIAQLGASYDFSVVKVFAQYFNTKTDPVGSASTNYNTYQLGATVTAGQGRVLASYAHTGSNVDHKTFSLAYDYDLSKRTDLYVAYMNDDANAYTDTINSFSIGMRHRF